MTVLFMTILPWMIRSQVVCHVNPFYYLAGPLQGVVFNNRYSQESAPTLPVSQVEVTPSPIPVIKTRTPNSAQKETVEQTTPTPVVYKDNPSVGKNIPILSPGRNILDSGWQQLGGVGSKLKFISSHFFHNLLTTSFIFPTTIFHDDINHIAAPKDSFWADNWDGRMGGMASVLFTINLVLIALGLSWFWKKMEISGNCTFVRLPYLLPGVGHRTHVGWTLYCAN